MLMRRDFVVIYRPTQRRRNASEGIGLLINILATAWPSGGDVAFRDGSRSD
jgi:hypothetical protein